MRTDCALLSISMVIQAVAKEFCLVSFYQYFTLLGGRFPFSAANEFYSAYYQMC